MKRFFPILLIIILSKLLNANDEGRVLFFGNCIACHGEYGKRVAPHFIEIKGYYMIAYPKREDFIENMAKWLSMPNTKNSKLPDAIAKYKLMPYLAIDLETLKDISAYIYDSSDFGGL